MFTANPDVSNKNTTFSAFLPCQTNKISLLLSAHSFLHLDYTYIFFRSQSSILLMFEFVVYSFKERPWSSWTSWATWTWSSRPCSRSSVCWSWPHSVQRYFNRTPNSCMTIPSQNIFFVQKIRQILRKSTGTEQNLLFSLHKHGSYFACFALLATNYPGRHDTMINQGYIFRILINRNKTKPTILWNI